MADTPKSFYWYDLETTGLSKPWDRMTQFAGLRTNADLEPIGEPLQLYIKPPDQVLLDPLATIVTGISPQLLGEQGISEWEAINKIHDELIQPGTCTIGYNNIEFDDHFIRFALYRNLFDPYRREFQNGNSRADLYKIVLAAAAMRPEKVEWPRKEDGERDFRLSSLAEANGIDAQGAHNALVDVHMSIALARRIKQAQPRLWDFLIRNRSKQDAKQLLTTSCRFHLHINRSFGAIRCCAAPVRVIYDNTERDNDVLVADLTSDLSMLESGTPEELNEARFLSKEEAEETGKTRLEILETRINQFTQFVPVPEALDDDMAERLQVDPDVVDKNTEMLNRIISREFRRKMSEMLSVSKAGFRESAVDVGEDLYSGGFIPNQVMRTFDRLRETLLHGDTWPRNLNFEEKRYAILANRLRHTVIPEDAPSLEKKYQQYVAKSLAREDVGLASKRLALEELRKEEQSQETLDLLDQIERQYNQLEMTYGH